MNGGDGFLRLAYVGIQGEITKYGAYCLHPLREGK